jgi:LacI family transcriptional regulator
MSPTIKDIALRSGFSTPTVSCVLNDKAHLFKPETREKIIAVARELGYTPNAAAKALRGQRTRTVGYIGNAYYIDAFVDTNGSLVMEGSDRRLNELGYRMLTSFCRRQEDRFLESMGSYRAQRVEGLLLYAVRFWGRWATPQSVMEALPPEIPTVTIQNIGPKSEAMFPAEIRTDSSTGFSQLFDHAFKLGHRRFAVVTSSLSTNRQKLASLEQAIAQSGLSDVSVRAIEKISSYHKAVDCVDEILAMNPRPTFVVCFSDLLAMGVIRGLSKRGLRVPEDISVSGYDNNPQVEMSDVPLTTVEQPFLELGRQAVDLLLELIEEEADVPVHERQARRRKVFREVPTSLVVRESTGPVKK